MFCVTKKNRIYDNSPENPNKLKALSINVNYQTIYDKQSLKGNTLIEKGKGREIL